MFLHKPSISEKINYPLYLDLFYKQLDYVPVIGTTWEYNLHHCINNNYIIAVFIMWYKGYAYKYFLSLGLAYVYMSYATFFFIRPWFNESAPYLLTLRKYPTRWLILASSLAHSWQEGYLSHFLIIRFLNYTLCWR